MIADFASVMVDPPRVRCLGVDLLPFSLGHLLTLRFIGSSFITSQPLPVDLAATAFVCSHTWEQNQKRLRTPARSAFTLSLWGLMTRKMSKKEASEVLHRYISEQLELPETKRAKGSGGGVKYLLSEWETRLFSHLRMLGYNDSEALNMPIALAHILFVAQLEKDDAMTFKTRHDMAVENEMNRILERMETAE